MQLSGIPRHTPETVRRLDLEFDVLRKCLADNVPDVAHEVSRVDRYALTFNSPAERQDLAHEVGAPLRTGAQRREHFPAKIAGHLPLQQSDRHEYRSEDVVEIVRNSAGQSADAFHALGAKELLLHFLARGYVGVDFEDGLGLAGIIADQRPADFRRYFPALLGAHFQLTTPLALVEQYLGGAFGACGFHEKQVARPFPNDLPGCPPVDLFGSPIPEKDPAGKAIYQANASAYAKRLSGLKRWAKSELSKVPRGQRKLVTAHNAFAYFAHEFGFHVIAVAGLNQEQDTAPKQLATTIESVRDAGVRAVFPEQNASRKSLESISKATGAKIAQPLIADGNGTGRNAGFEGMIRHNVNAITKALATP